MNIEPGIGLGHIKYGINEIKLIEILGKPSKIGKVEYIEGSGDWSKTLFYSKMNLDFSFDVDVNYRLGIISISGPGYTLFGKDLFGLKINFIKSFISKKTNEIPKYEDHSWDPNNKHECLDYDKLGIILWFDSGYLSEMQCGYLFEDDGDTIIWP